jgi:hypothetical protein
MLLQATSADARCLIGSCDSELSEGYELANPGILLTAWRAREAHAATLAQQQDGSTRKPGHKQLGKVHLCLPGSAPSSW